LGWVRCFCTRALREGAGATVEAAPDSSFPENGLVGRTSELARLHGVVRRAARQLSGTLVIVGEPGSGKSTLLNEFAGQLEGATLLRAAGSGFEQGMAFASVARLLQPVFHLVDALPSAQRSALRAVLALDDGPQIDRFAAYVGLLGVFATAAEQAPVVVLVDDFHWLDPASAEALLFVTRRLEAERVAVLLATRPGNLGPIEGFARLDLDGIQPGDVDELLFSQTGVVLTQEVASALHSRTAGNPLALIEASRALDDEQRRGLRALPNPIPVGRQLDDFYHRRLQQLPQVTQDALIIASACDADDAAVLQQALACAGQHLASLEPAEDAFLLKLRDGHFSFAHPLLRSATYYSAPVAKRRAAHACLAEASTGKGREDARAWHLLKASAGPNAAAADELVELAARARVRQAPAVASRALQAAADLTPDPSLAAGRRLQAAVDAQLGGHASDAILLARRAQDGTDEPAIVGNAMLIEGRLGFWEGTPGAVDLMARAAFIIAEVDPSAGGMALAEAALNACYEQVERGLALAEDPLYLQAPEPIRRIIEVSSKLTQDTWGTVRASMLDMYPTLLVLDPLLNPWVPQTYGRGLVILECWPEARAIHSKAIDAVRLAGAMSQLPHLLASQAEIDFRTNRWWRAYADATEALRIAQETGGPRGWCLALLALVEAGQGRAAESMAHASEAVRIGSATENRGLRLWARWAQGLLEMGRERHADALAYFRAQHEDAAISGLIQQPVWTLERIEALIRCGHRAEASRTLETIRTMDLRDNADDRIRLHRCEALFTLDDSEAFEHFEAALAIAGESPFDRARTQLAFAQRLRAAPHASDGTDQLQAALATFTNLGAADWVHQTERELGAGDRRHSLAKPRTLAALSARELQVAELLASGASNRIIARSLFLSEKTVEAHLRNCFKKLDIGSRVELARIIIRSETPI
jgi:DNA-binding CsgD family transcriptional regulator